MQKAIAKMVTWNLFSPNHYFSKLKFRQMPDTYVSETITEKEIASWKNIDSLTSSRYPILISAQTGRGKNHFITHVLREYAKRNGERILYISNRTALDYQQKQELAELTHTDFSVKPMDSDNWGKIEDFSNVTVITYHKLQRYFHNKNEKWFQSFSYVVIDECHFFYSDALFNASTGYILENIVKYFCNSIRIYMSATFEDVLEPIRYYEGLENRAMDFGNHFDCNPYAYEFPRDFSNYNCRYFLNFERISELICSRNRKHEKWLIFVTSKVHGTKLRDELNETCDKGKEIAIYLDSQSRDEAHFSEAQAWQYLKANATFLPRVLITTAVLDNGFSIKDPNVKNIVICTHDKTEFLQELGRCRVQRGENINLFIRIMTDKAHANRKRYYETYFKLFLDFCGEEDSVVPGADSKFSKIGDPIHTVQNLWTSREDFRRGVIYLTATQDNNIYPSINSLARWRTILLGKQLEDYERLQEKFGDRAAIIYKARWLNGDAENLSTEYLQEHNLEYEGMKGAQKALVEFLKARAKDSLSVQTESAEFESFSKEFFAHYKAAHPKDGSINRGKGRDYWKVTAIRNHLEKINQQLPEIKFEFEPVQGQKNMYSLCVVENGAVSQNKSFDDVTSDNSKQ